MSSLGNAWVSTSGLALCLALGAVACGSTDDGEDLASAGSAGAGAGGSAAAGAGQGGSAGAAGSNTAGSSAAGSNAGGANAGSDAGGSGECGVSVVESPPTSALHVTECSAIEYSTSPPSGGDHYGQWPAYASYDFALPAGNVVHALEHGAVVFWYNCPEGCPNEVAEVEAFIAQLPADPTCAGTGAERRTIVVPSPELEARWAASAWGFALTASCFDPAAFEAFYMDHYRQGPEDTCAPGQAFSVSPCP